MKLQLLPSSFEPDGRPSARQHLSTFVIDDKVSIDAGSLGPAVSDHQRASIRDVVLTHAHLDHIAGLPLFIDDLFSAVREPIRIYASQTVIEILEEHVFNWKVYPRFSELANAFGPVVEYRVIEAGKESAIAHLFVTPVEVNHSVPSTGFIVRDGASTIAITGDTAEMSSFWDKVNGLDELSALLVECAFPNELEPLARISSHMTPSRLARDLAHFGHAGCPIYVINVKPMYRETTVSQLAELHHPSLELLEVGRVYEF